MSSNSYALSTYELEQRSFISKVYGWMFLGLSVTGIIAYYITNNPEALFNIFGNYVKAVFPTLLILEAVLVGYLVG